MSKNKSIENDEQYINEQKEFYNDVRNALISGISYENSAKYDLQEKNCDIYTYVPFSDEECLRIELCRNAMNITWGNTKSALSAINDIAEQIVDGKDIRDLEYRFWYRPNEEMENNFEIVQKALQSIEIPHINSFSNESTFKEDTLFFEKFIDKLGNEYHQINSEIVMEPVGDDLSANIYNFKNNFLMTQDFEDFVEKNNFKKFGKLLDGCQKITVKGHLDDVRRITKVLNECEKDFNAPNYVKQKDEVLRFIVTDKEEVKNKVLTMKELDNFSKKVEKEKQKNIIHGIDKNKFKAVAKRLVKSNHRDKLKENPNEIKR